MAVIKNKYFWTAGYVSLIAWHGYQFIGLHSFEFPWRKFNGANVKRF